MELKHYFEILRRRWMLVVAVPALVLVAVAIQMATTVPHYSASARVTVTRAPQQMGIDYFRFNEYYLYLASEFAIDDLVEVVRGNVFAEDVRQALLETEGVDVSAGDIQMAIFSERRHRILTLEVTTDDPDRSIQIARAAANRLEQDAMRYFGFQSDERFALVSIVETPESAGSSQNRERIIWLLQFLIAGFAGILLAFLYDTFEDSLHTEEMVRDALDLDVLASIPAGRWR